MTTSSFSGSGSATVTGFNGTAARGTISGVATLKGRRVNTAEREAFGSEVAAETTDAFAYTFNAADQAASAYYLALWSMEAQSAFATNPVAGNTNGRSQLLVAGSVVHALPHNLHEAASPVDYLSVGSIYRFQAASTPVDTLFQLQNASVQNANVIPRNHKNTRLTLLKMTAADVYAEALSNQSTSNTTATVAASFTPPEAGDYLIIATFQTTSSTAAADLAVDLYDGANASAEVVNRQAAASRPRAGTIAWRRNGLSGSQPIDLRYKTSSGSVTISNVRMVGLWLGNFANVYDDYLSSDDGGTETNYTDTGLSITETPDPANHLVLAVLNTMAADTSISAYAEVLDDGSAIAEHVYEPQLAARPIPMFTHRLASYLPTSRTWKVRRKTETGTAAATVGAGSALIVLDLTEPATPQDLALGGLVNAPAFGGLALRPSVAAGGATSAWAAGGFALTQRIAAGGIADSDAFGASALVQLLGVGGLSNMSAPGGFVSVACLAVGGLASAGAFGGLSARLGLAPGGVSDPEAFGGFAIGVEQQLSPGGLADDDSLGGGGLRLSLTPGGLTVVNVAGGLGLGQTLTVGGVVDPDTFGGMTFAFVDALVVGGLADPDAFGGGVARLQVQVGGLANASAFGGLTVTPEGVLVVGGHVDPDGFGCGALRQRLVIGGHTNATVFGGHTVAAEGVVVVGGLADPDALGAFGLRLRVAIGSHVNASRTGGFTIAAEGGLLVGGWVDADAVGGGRLLQRLAPGGLVNAGVFGGMTVAREGALTPGGLVDPDVLAGGRVCLSLRPGGLAAVSSTGGGRARLRLVIGGLADDDGFGGFAAEVRTGPNPRLARQLVGRRAGDVLVGGGSTQTLKGRASGGGIG